jgi:hypothetical protein
MLESLESRTMFAANVVDASPTATALNFTKDQVFSLNFSKIKFDTKVAMQDFHFTSKVAQQDFHFVMKNNPSSPK